MPRRGSPTAVLAALAVVLAAAPRIPLLVTGARDQDEGVYRLTLSVAGHAPLYRDLYLSQPPLFPTLLVPWRALTGGSLAADRAGVLVVFLAGVALAVAWLVRAGGPAVGAVAAVALAADPALLRAATSVMAEGPAMGAALAAVGVAGLWGRRPAGGVAAGALLAAAVLCKLLALPAAVPVGLLVAGGPRPRRGLALAAAGALAVAATAGLLLGSDLGSVAGEAVGLHLGSRHLAVGGIDQELVTALLLEVPVAAAAAAGALAARRALGIEVAALGAWTVTAAAAVALQAPLWPHHLAAVAAPLACLAGTAARVRPSLRDHRVGPAAPLWRRTRPRATGADARARPSPLAAVATVVIVAAGGTATALLAAAAPAAPSPVLVAALRRLPAGTTVVSDAQEAVVEAGRTTPPPLVDTSWVRVLSGDLDAAHVEAAITAARPVAVVLATGRLAAVPGLTAWLRARAGTPREVGGAEIWLLDAAG